MPMVYVSEETARLIEKIAKFLQENAHPPGRILKADVIQTALAEYAKKLNLGER
jgi:phosphatidate phosphatase APP1